MEINISSNGIHKEKKQKSWFRTEDEIDFENSFKFWFALMWQNFYMQIFLGSLIVFTIELFNFKNIKELIGENFAMGGNAGGIFTLIGVLLPSIIFCLVSYKGFYQYWKELKKMYIK